MEVIRVRQVKKYIAQRELFSLPSLSINRGDKIALIGANGVGKTTFLKLVAGLDNDYEGQIMVRGKVTYVPQLKEKSSLSGGEETKKYLSEAFSQKPDVLVLDEPSANLDKQNLNWLLKQLRRFRGTLLFVSHDRYLINQLSDQIWLLNKKTIKVYMGNYDDFEQIQKDELERNKKDYKAYHHKVKQLSRSAEEKQVKANKMKKRKKSVSSSEWKARSLAGNYDGQQKAMAKSARSMKKRIEKLETVVKPKEKRGLKIKEIGNHLPLGGKLIHLKESELTLGGQVLFSYPEWVIKSGDKITLSGDNGTGKTSFVQALFNRELNAYYSPRLTMSYFSQNFNILELEKTALENLSRTSSQQQADLINLLAALDLSYDQIQQPLYSLSGGERVKVQLAKVLCDDANLIILDEPTNYLDLPTILALEDFIKEYRGTMILISHDTTFLNNLNCKNYTIENGKLTRL